MKKTHLFAATALLSVLMISGIAHAKSNDTLPYYMNSGSYTTTEAQAPTSVTPPAPMMRGEHRMRHDMSNLSDPSEKMMRETMQKMHEDNKGLMDAMMAKHQELQAIVKAPTFDKAAYLAKHEELQGLHHKMGTARVNAMAAVLEKMPAADRAQMAGMGMGMMKHGKHHMGKGMMGKGGCPMMDGAAADEVPAKKTSKK